MRRFRISSDNDPKRLLDDVTGLEGASPGDPLSLAVGLDVVDSRDASVLFDLYRNCLRTALGILAEASLSSTPEKLSIYRVKQLNGMCRLVVGKRSGRQ